MNLRLESAARPIASCTAALSDQARHQSLQLATLAVTSSKSVSATPFATNRGPQCAMADLTMASIPNSLRPHPEEHVFASAKTCVSKDEHEHECPPSPFETLTSAKR